MLGAVSIELSGVALFGALGADELLETTSLAATDASEPAVLDATLLEIVDASRMLGVADASAGVAEASAGVAEASAGVTETSEDPLGAFGASLAADAGLLDTLSLGVLDATSLEALGVGSFEAL